MGYGTKTGGKMIDSLFADSTDLNGLPYYLSYYDENYELHEGISKIDENNLKKLATDMGIDYVYMNKKSNIEAKIKEIQKNIIGNKAEETITSYQDTYYYISWALLALLVVEFILKKRRI